MDRGSHDTVRQKKKKKKRMPVKRFMKIGIMKVKKCSAGCGMIH